jgi:protease-4
MKNKLGITFDGIKTGKYADMPSATRPLNAMEQHFIQAGVDSVYFNFKSRVAQGRHKSIEYIDSIAQGRVWTGADAMKVGLVDRIGTLKDAIAAAAKMAHLKGYSIKSLPEQKSFLNSIIDDYEDNVKAEVVGKEIGMEQYELFKQLKSIKQMMGTPQTRMPIFVVNRP